MIRGIVEHVNQLATLAVRTTRFHWVVRGGLVLVSALVWLVLALLAPGLGSNLAGFTTLCAGVVVAIAPNLVGVLPLLPALAWWLVAHQLRPWQLGVLVLLVWLAHRLSCWAATGPSHAVVDAATVRLLAIDAAKEFGWLLAVLGLMVGGRLLVRIAPGDGNWAVVLLVTLAASSLAWFWSLRSR